MIDDELSNFDVYRICGRTDALNDYGLSSSEKLVLFIINTHYNHERQEAFPSLGTILRLSSLSKPTVIKCIQELKDKKVLKIETCKRENSHLNKNNRYSYTNKFLDHLKRYEKGHFLEVREEDL